LNVAIKLRVNTGFSAELSVYTKDTNDFRKTKDTDFRKTKDTNDFKKIFKVNKIQTYSSSYFEISHQFNNDEEY